jgi:perosamine synthetase
MRKTGVPIIEDCSHGIGRGEMGSGGDVAMLSLYATKLVGAGQGGIVLTSDESIACRIRDAADYVDKPKSAHRWRETMSSPEAALALCQLDRLSANLNRRDQIAARYSEEFSEVRKPLSHPYRVWYRYTICCDTAASLIAKLGVRNVCAAVPIDNWLTEDESASLPIASRAYRQLVSLPIFPSLKKHEQERVIAAVHDALD